MKALQAIQDWKQERLAEGEPTIDSDAPAWFLSLVVHLGVLLVMAMIFQITPKKDIELSLTTLDTKELEALPEEFEYSNESQIEIGSNSDMGTGAALALAPSLDEMSRIEATELPTEMPTASEMLLHEFSSAPAVSKNMLVKGAAGEGATGASGAIDRITQEILDSLQERRTLVVWLFDQSLSMMAQRQEISERFERIYEELGVIQSAGDESFTKHGEEPLLTSVMAFGSQVSFRTKDPTADIEELRSAVTKIENDSLGTEMVFTAVGMAAKKYQTFRTQAPRRNVMIVVVSDEVGDDEQQLDPVLSLCRRLEMPVYCIGIPAPFARREIEVAFVDPDPQYDQSVVWLPVRQGPETVLPEAVRISFASGRNEDVERMDSGFGPYALTRLCYESGGIYFAVHAGRGNNSQRRGNKERSTGATSANLAHFFDPAVMRSYQPEYLSAKEYEKRLAQNKARAALVQAATMSTVNPMENPRLEFLKVDEAALKRSLDEAQQAAAKIGPKIDALYQTLKMGEKDRRKLVEPRWRAGYDLALGRVLAVKVRTESYNSMLAKAKGGLKFAKPESDTHVLVPANEISVGSAMEKLAKQAREHLERVRTEHAGTPWALVAERELKEPIGWKWSEKVTNPPAPPRMEAAAGTPPPPAPDTLRNLPKPKPKRPNFQL